MSKPSQNRFITVQELCELIGVSKNRFYSLQKAGIFPAALRSPLNNRPVFDSALVEQCLGIVRHRVGANGAPWVPNRKNPVVSTTIRSPASSRHKDLITALMSLGLTVTAGQIDEGVKKLPDSGQGMDEAELIRRLFLELRKQP
jgi:hypothetical protein